MVINGLKTKKLHTDLMTLALKKKKYGRNEKIRFLVEKSETSMIMNNRK